MAIPSDPPAHLVHHTRPVYMDDIFRGCSPRSSSARQAPVESAAPSISRAPSQSISSFSSSSTSSLSWRSFSISSVSTNDNNSGMPCGPRSPISTRSLPTTRDDTVSVRSIRSRFSPRFRRMRSLLNRHRPDPIVDEVEETTPTDIFYGAGNPNFDPSQLTAASRTPPAVASQPSSGSTSSSSSKLTAIRDLDCQPCYYAYARRCPGFVMGGSHGDACDACARAGFLGAP